MNYGLYLYIAPNTAIIYPKILQVDKAHLLVTSFHYHHHKRGTHEGGFF